MTSCGKFLTPASLGRGQSPEIVTLTQVQIGEEFRSQHLPAFSDLARLDLIGMDEL